MEMSKAKAENRPLPKRFYAAASVQQKEGVFVITLDEKPIRTPQQKLLHSPSKDLAQRIADEWSAQAEFIDTNTMPLTRLLNIALDRIAIDRDALLKEMVQYAETDLLCYRAPEAESALPIASIEADLRKLQAQHFDPVLTWVQQTYDVSFQVTDGIMPVRQSDEALEMVHTQFASANDHELAALAMMVPLVGSSLLVLALWKGQLSCEQMLQAARLDETVQAQQWTEDAEAAAAWAAKQADIVACTVFLNHTA